MSVPPLITLTTDFGVDSPYIAQLKGVLHNRLPGVCLVDVTHSIPPQDVGAGALVLADTVGWFPSAVHIAVVDPGVGTKRSVLAGKLTISPGVDGWFVGPDNGLFSRCEIVEVVRLDQPGFWLPDVSATFHGRDIMAPVAVALAQGVPLGLLGQRCDDWVRLPVKSAVNSDGKCSGEVIAVDSFGNLITNLTADMLSAAAGRDTFQPSRLGQVSIAGQVIPVVRCYGDATPGSLVALIGSSGRLEIAVVNGNAATSVGRDHEVSLAPRTSQ